MLQFCGIGRIERIELRAAFEQAQRLIHRLVLDRSAHARPDEVSQLDAMCLANRIANFGDFGRNLLRPFGMVVRLPAQIQDAVGILGYVTAGVRLCADSYERIVGWPECGESSDAYASIERTQPVENLFGGESIEPGFGGTSVVEGKPQAPLYPFARSNARNRYNRIS